MGYQRCLIGFLCLGIALTSSASHKEELERAAELAVERAAERAAERAVEKALESGNTTTESKIVRESYSSVRKDPRKEKKDYDDHSGRYASVDDEVEPEEDADDWSLYSRARTRFVPRGSRNTGFRSWSSKIDFKDVSDIWKRFPRSYWSEEDSWEKSKEKVATTGRKIPATFEKNTRHRVYKQVPYEVKVPVPQSYTAEKRVSYPARVYAPVEIPEPYYVEKQVPYEVKADNPYKVEMPVSQPYTEKMIPVEIKRPYTVGKTVSYEVKVLTPHEKKVLVPVEVTVDRPYPIPVSTPNPIKDPQPYNVEKRVPAEIVKPYFVPVEKPYEVYETKPTLVPAKRPFSYAPILVKLGWKNQGNVKDKEEDLAESESAETNWRRPR